MELKERRTQDRKFAEVALREGLINQQQLIDGVNAQRSLEREGNIYSLSRILVEKFYISEEDAAYVENGGAPLTHQFSQQKIEELLEEEKRQKGKTPHPPDTEEYSNLEVIEGEDQGIVFPLQRKENTIGRVKGADFRLSDTTISRIHCKVSYIDEVWYIIDMMSSHGVFLNGKRIREKTTLYEDDELQLGKTVLKVVI